jgi:two-component system chemotaxis response regulator CheY
MPALIRLSTILVVEDQEDEREALRALLEEEGYRVACVEDGAKALDYLRAHEAPALILLDLMMPTMDGYEFRTRQLGDPALATIPVVAFSGDARGKSLGFVGFAKKPIDPSRLLAVVREYGTA